MVASIIRKNKKYPKLVENSQQIAANININIAHIMTGRLPMRSDMGPIIMGKKAVAAKYPDMESCITL